MSTPIRLPAALLRQQIDAVLTAWGMREADRMPTVDVMIETDLRGIDSYGIAMLPLYAVVRRQGKIVDRPEIAVIEERPVTALIDGGGGLGHAPSTLAMGMAIDKARAAGLAAVAVRNSNHFGAAGAYALMAARAGLIGIAMTNAGSRAIVPTRAREPVFGTNPIAFAAPAGRNKPFVLDMATSTVAVGKVKLAAYADKAMPEGWVSDPEGAAVTDPHQAFDGHGRLALGYGISPLGGLAALSSHKGYGLAAMVEVLCSMLPGAPFIGQVENRQEHETGHFFMALDPSAFRSGSGFADELDGMMDHLRGLAPAEADKPVLVPGDPEDAAHADRSVNGIPLPAMLLDSLREVCLASNAAYLLDSNPASAGADR